MPQLVEWLLILTFCSFITRSQAHFSKPEPKCGAFYWPGLSHRGQLDRPQDEDAAKRLLIAGESALPGQFPFQVLVTVAYSYKSENGTRESDSASFAGVIIGKSTVLVPNLLMNLKDPCSLLWQGHLEGAYINSVGSPLLNFGLTYSVVSYTPHPKYKCTFTYVSDKPMFFIENNIAILEIKGQFRFRVNQNGGINRVCLPEVGLDYGSGDYKGFFSGFGVEREEDESADRLRFMATTFVDNPVCKSRLEKEKTEVPASTVCLGVGPQSSLDKKLCGIGEVGGGLVRFVDARWELVGFYSHWLLLPECSATKLVFVKVADHVNWIRQIVNDVKRIKDN